MSSRVDNSVVRSDTMLPIADDRDEGTFSDEDLDMSDDGGAALTMTLSHAEQLNAELDELDAAVMGSQNLAGLFNPYTEDIEFYDDEIMTDDGLQPGPLPSSNLPVVMSAVSQQLQHIQDHVQDGQGDEGVQHADINSTSPFHFHPVFPQNAGTAGSIVETGFVSLADLTAPQPAQPQVAHPWGSEGWANSVALLTQGHLTVAAHQPHASLTTWEDDQLTDADDEDPVENEHNPSFVEFLYTWAHEATRDRDTDSKRRPRGPAAAAIDEQRELKFTSPLTRDQLRGDECDIQGVNWSELGVSRLEARQMRRKTYKNYSNVPLQQQWHVSRDTVPIFARPDLLTLFIPATTKWCPSVR
jgi:hypothetical protein